MKPCASAIKDNVQRLKDFLRSNGIFFQFEGGDDAYFNIFCIRGMEYEWKIGINPKNCRKDEKMRNSKIEYTLMDGRWGRGIAWAFTSYKLKEVEMCISVFQELGMEEGVKFLFKLAKKEEMEMEIKKDFV